MAKFNYMAYWQEQQKKLIDSKLGSQKTLQPTKKGNSNSTPDRHLNSAEALVR